MGDTERNTDARIAVATETRDLVRSKKRGGETYDQLLRKMAAQYEPAERPDDSAEEPGRAEPRAGA
jgi:hypothetical protein